MISDCSYISCAEENKKTSPWLLRFLSPVFIQLCVECVAFKDDDDDEAFISSPWQHF